MDQKHYSYIDALRGYAILAVMATHTSQLFPTWSGFIRKLVDQGARGVELFFLASAITLMMSWSSRHDGMRNFYIRRLFRIAPMFWLAIVLYIWLHGLGPHYWAPDGINGYAIFITAVFAHSWNPAYFNSVVPGGWSIGVEMSFYLVFPFLAYYFRDAKKSLWGLLASLVIAHISFTYVFAYRQFLWPQIAHDYLTWNMVNLWFLNELPVFMTGIYLYFLITKVPSPCSLTVWKKEMVLIFSLCLMVWLAQRSDPYYLFYGYLSIYAAYGFAFALFAFSLAKGSGKYLVNPVITTLGKMSFSAYLWHFAVIKYLGSSFLSSITFWIGSIEQPALTFFGLLLGIVLVTSALSWFTYRFIEIPMIRLGNNWILRLDQRSL